MLASTAKPRGKHAAIVVLSSDSYRLLSVENCGSCGGAPVAVVSGVAELPRKSSNLGAAVNMERLVAPTRPGASGDASTVLLPEVVEY